MAPTSKFLPLFFLLSLCFSTTIISGEEEDCVYTVFVRTGSIIKGGTDSIIGLKLYDNFGWYIYIKNLESWGGLMDPGHNYFERGNLDIFSGRGPCLDGPVCAVNVTSDGSGAHHGWYVNYVEVTSTGVHQTCAQNQFTLEQWIATDTSPYQLWAEKNLCGNQLGLGLARPKTKVVHDVGSGSGYSILDSGVGM
ncbi:hypothetical protein Lal_00003522 [Lupinus albus]|uniref:Putative PLAT/LH2 domain-containing protein n=1 Tax=Lupinus albus TaxID=3870 RepID=A0A6A5M8M8_LUPAL|nr:putative PLAT/LH2 domain-containing protein [Lupinus albus]KAF1870316.1 hypothetical protein Lal_00003522 [Lupinus albus]